MLCKLLLSLVSVSSGAAVLAAGLPTIPEDRIPTKAALAEQPMAKRALDELRKQRGALLKQPPISVTFDKKLPSPGGDPRDFTSCGPYWWPDPARPDGLPYIRRDGRFNPDFRSYDQTKIGRVGRRITAGTLLWHFDRDREAAESRSPVTATVTVTRVSATRSPALVRMVHSPAPTPVTVPAPSTVATASSLEAYCSGSPLAPSGVSAAASGACSPVASAIASGAEIPVAAGSSSGRVSTADTVDEEVVAEEDGDELVCAPQPAMLNTSSAAVSRAKSFFLCFILDSSFLKRPGRAAGACLLTPLL